MNQWKTFLLIGVLSGLFGLVGLMIGGQGGMAMALLLAMGGNLFAFFASDRLVLGMYGAEEVKECELVAMVDELRRRAGLPMPRVYRMQNPQPNAFATGRSPAHGAVAVTDGLMQLLTQAELRGVIAHELAHIQRRDTLIMTITATLAGALSSLGNFFLLFGGGRDEEGRSLNPVVALLVVILAPIAAMMVQMAISRTREYGADARGAEICGDPMALASALAKIEQAAHRVPNWQAENHPASAHLFIINPLHARKMDNLFSTHPNTENRINALRAMVPGLSVTPQRKSRVAGVAAPWRR